MATSELLASADEQFAIASGVDPDSGEYRGLVIPPAPDVSLTVTDSMLLVDYNQAVEQRQRELQRAAEEQARLAALAEFGTGEDGATGTRVAATVGGGGTGGASGIGTGGVPGWPPAPGRDSGSGDGEPARSAEQPKTIFFATATVDRNAYSKQLRLIAQELIGLLEDADNLEITVDIRATKAAGFTEQEQRTIAENAHTLKFERSSFEG